MWTLGIGVSVCGRRPIYWQWPKDCVSLQMVIGLSLDSKTSRVPNPIALLAELCERGEYLVSTPLEGVVFLLAFTINWSLDAAVMVWRLVNQTRI